MSGASRVRPHGAPVVLIVAAVLAWAPMAPAADLGRLFLSPGERSALDRLRYRSETEPPQAEPAAAPATPLEALAETLPPAADPVRVDGYVARSGGPATIWVNGANNVRGEIAAGATDANAPVLVGDRDRVRVPVTGVPGGVALKPGQTFDPALERVTDAYEQPPEGFLAPD